MQELRLREAGITILGKQSRQEVQRVLSQEEGRLAIKMLRRQDRQKWMTEYGG